MVKGLIMYCAHAYRSTVLIMLLLLLLAAVPAQAKLEALPLDKQTLEKFENIDNSITELLGLAEQELKTLAELDVIRQSNGRISVYNKLDEPIVLVFDNLPVYDQQIYHELMVSHYSNPNFGLIFLGTIDGGFVQAPDKDTIGPHYDPRERLWYKEALAGRQDYNVSTPYASTSGFTVISTTRKVFDKNNKLAGVLALDVDLMPIINNYNKLASGEHDFVIIIGRQNSLSDLISIAHNDNEWFSLTPRQLKELEPMYDINEGVWKTKFHCSEKIIINYTSKVLGWKIVVVSDMDACCLPETSK